MYRNNHGFTLIEIIAVLVLMSIIAAGVMVRGMNTDQIDLMAQAAKIRNHIRYAQAMAMKRNEIWGINCAAGEYWQFKNSTSNPVRLPGEKVDKISLADLGVGMNEFRVYFNKLGEPYKSYPPSQQVKPTNVLTITISGASDSVTLSVTPETGLIQ
jgi:prepilin-type N-terminal cleavage/methylation domain-containing protein